MIWLSLNVCILPDLMRLSKVLKDLKPLSDLMSPVMFNVNVTLSFVQPGGVYRDLARRDPGALSPRPLVRRIIHKVDIIN